jgi:hypothetical protein
MKHDIELITPSDVFDKKMLARALTKLGDYVYGYYFPRGFREDDPDEAIEPRLIPLSQACLNVVFWAD